MNAAHVPHILVVDDDRRLRKLLEQYLTAQGWRITVAKNAAEARTLLAWISFDLLLLDIMMPGESGLDMAKDIQGSLTTPILFLTAMAETGERIAGLEAGAEDYVTKPFEPKELVLRIQVILRRQQLSGPKQAALVFGPYRFDPHHRELRKGEDVIYLTATELDLLACLAEQAGQTISRAHLMERLMGESQSERGVDVQMTRLRKKLEEEPSRPLFLQTVRGEGYVLRAREDRQA